MDKAQPPKFAKWLLKKFCREEHLEIFLGDLEELFYQRINTMGVQNARWIYTKEVLSLFRPFALKRIQFRSKTNQTVMLLNYLKIAWRNLFKHRIQSSINILGLTIGILVYLFLYQYVQFERSYDKWHTNVSEIYRLRFDRIYEDKHDKSAGITPFVGPYLKQEFPEVLDYTKLWQFGGNSILQYQDISFRQENIYYADSSFFQVFSYPLKAGSPSQVLSDVNTMVLSERVAQKLFGNEDPIGNTVKFNSGGSFREYVISGIAENSPENTHLKFDVLLSFKTLVQATDGRAHDFLLGWNAFLTYLKVQPGTDKDLLEQKLEAFTEKYYARMKERNIQPLLLLQPLESIHLESNLRFEPEPNGNGKMVSFLLILAFFILAIAWFNYVNLATARTSERTKEVGIRKVAGANRLDLVRQFLLEALLINGISIILAVGLLVLLQPIFNSMIGKDLPLSILYSPIHMVEILGVLVFGALISSIYPAGILASFSPVKMFSNKKVQFKGINVRRGLVIFQFAISIILIAGTLVVSKQINFMRNQDLGVDLDKVIVLNGPDIVDSTFTARFNSFKEEVGRLNAISGHTNSTTIPGREITWVNNSVRWAKRPETEVNSIPIMGIGPGFFKTFQLETIVGRTFSEDYQQDSNRVVLTAAAARKLGFTSPEAALNEQVRDGDYLFEVIGVTEDFNQQSLNMDYHPVIFRYLPNSISYFSFKVDTDDYAQVLASLESQWKAQFPGNPFDYFFMDEFFDRQYKADLQFGQIFGIFSLLAILIAILGLFGLSTLLIARRTKEIGIRKVLGASIQSLFIHLSLGYLKLVLVAIIFAIPAIYYLGQLWLNNYAFHIKITWWVFIIPAFIVTLIAITTVGYKSIKAALANPVKALKHE